MAGLRIATMGATFVPNSKIYGKLEDFGQVYRRGSIFTPRGGGMVLGRTVVVKLTGNTQYDRYLLQHETGHQLDINKMGAFEFYKRTISEYAKYGQTKTYTTFGTLEYSAEQYAFNKLGYYYNYNYGYRTFFP